MLLNEVRAQMPMLRLKQSRRSYGLTVSPRLSLSEKSDVSVQPQCSRYLRVEIATEKDHHGDTENTEKLLPERNYSVL